MEGLKSGAQTLQRFLSLASRGVKPGLRARSLRGALLVNGEYGTGSKCRGAAENHVRLTPCACGCNFLETPDGMDPIGRTSLFCLVNG
jgi:hypothetical protein